MASCKRIRMIRKLLRVGLLLAVVVALTLARSSVAFFEPALADQGGSSMWTDKADYGLGETVTITGTGWFPNETVSMVIHQDPQRNPDTYLTSLTDENGTCTFNNTQLGFITIKKQTLPDGGTDFWFTSNVGAVAGFRLDDDATLIFTNVLPGTYTITESSLPTGWDLTDISCSGSADVQIGTDSDFDLGDTSVTIDLGPGESATCTFRNERPFIPQAPEIHLTKTPDKSQAYVGDTIVYTYAVTIPGNISLENITVNDNKCVSPTYQSGDANSNNWLEAGEAWVYTCSHVVIAGDNDPLVNTATARGYDESGVPAEDDDDATVDILTGPVVVGGTVVPVDKAAIWRRGLLCLSPL